MEKNEIVRNKPSVRLSSQLREKVNDLADKKGISRNAMLEAAVQAGMAFILLKEEIGEMQ